jgi:hypothetical protein
MLPQGTKQLAVPFRNCPPQISHVMPPIECDMSKCNT